MSSPVEASKAKHIAFGGIKSQRHCLLMRQLKNTNKSKHHLRLQPPNVLPSDVPINNASNCLIRYPLKRFLQSRKAPKVLRSRVSTITKGIALQDVNNLSHSSSTTLHKVWPLEHQKPNTLPSKALNTKAIAFQGVNYLRGFTMAPLYIGVGPKHLLKR